MSKYRVPPLPVHADYVHVNDKEISILSHLIHHDSQHGVRCCKNPFCVTRFVHRDIQSARCIGDVHAELRKTGRRPLHYAVHYHKKWHEWIENLEDKMPRRVA